MSNSDSDDVDFDIQSPEPVKARKGGRATAKNKPLAPKNKNSAKVHSDDRRKKNGKKRSSDPKWDDSSEDDRINLDSDDDVNRRKGENRPPPNRSNINMVDSENSEDEISNVRKQTNARARKRLSILPFDVSKVSSSISGVNQNLGPTPDPETLKNIYASCIDLFQAQKITIENAFQIRFLDLMGDIIDLPDFNKHDMLGAGRMLEAGAKVYVCRVEKTKHAVLDLASTLKIQQRKQKKTDEHGEDLVQGLEQNEPDDQDSQQSKQDEDVAKKRKKRKMKEHRFIAEDSKISLAIEVESCKGAARRSALKAKLQHFIENDLDFDYYNEYLSEQEVDARPADEEEQENLFRTAKCVVPAAVINIDEIANLEQLPFVLLEQFDKRVHNVWGKLIVDKQTEHPLNGNEEIGVFHAQGIEQVVEDLQSPSPVQDEFAYIPLPDPPAEYNRDLGDLEDDGGFANDTFVNDEAVELSNPELARDPKRINSLQDFFQLYTKMKSQLAWCGPDFVKPHRFLPNGGPKKSRVKKTPVFIDVINAEKKNRNNKFFTNKTVKTVIDERLIEDWGIEGKRRRPFMVIDELEDDYEGVLELLKDEKSGVPPLFRYYWDDRKPLFKISVPTAVGDEERFHDFNKAEDDYILDAGFEVDRHDEDNSFHDNFGGHDLDIQLPGGETAVPFSASFELPGSLGRFPFESESSTKNGDSIKFTNKPKPIDMHALKRAIVNCLEESLQIDRDGTPKLEVETKIDFLSLVKYVFRNVDRKTVEHLSLSIIIVGLLHVVVDKKLFIIPENLDPTNPSILCRGSTWKHSDHIPMPDPFADDD